MSDWFFYFGLPVVAAGLLIGGAALFALFLITKFVLRVAVPSQSHRAQYFFGFVLVGSLLAFDGYLVAELGYQLHFWDAPGIWGAPGKPDTVWGRIEYALPLAGLVLGVLLNTAFEFRIPGKAGTARIIVIAISSMLFVVTELLGARNAWQTLG